MKLVFFFCWTGCELSKKRRRNRYGLSQDPPLQPPIHCRPRSLPSPDVLEWMGFVVAAQSASFTSVSEIFASRVMIFLMNLAHLWLKMIFFFSRKVCCRLVIRSGSTVATLRGSQSSRLSGYPTFCPFSTVYRFLASWFASLPVRNECTWCDGENIN